MLEGEETYQGRYICIVEVLRSVAVVLIVPLGHNHRLNINPRSLHQETTIMSSGASNQYKPAYAENDGRNDAAFCDFITNFYRRSDNSEENQGWVDSFTQDAFVQIGVDKASGSKG